MLITIIVNFFILNPMIFAYLLHASCTLYCVVYSPRTCSVGLYTLMWRLIRSSSSLQHAELAYTHTHTHTLLHTPNHASSAYVCTHTGLCYDIYLLTQLHTPTHPYTPTDPYMRIPVSTGIHTLKHTYSFLATPKQTNKQANAHSSLQTSLPSRISKLSFVG